MLGILGPDVVVEAERKDKRKPRSGRIIDAAFGKSGS